MKANLALSQIEQLVKLALENTDMQQPKGIPRSVRFPEEVDKRVNDAMEILGCDRTEIVVECVRMNFDAVVQGMIESRERKAQEWKKAGAAGAAPAPTSQRVSSTKSNPGAKGGAASSERKASHPEKRSK